MTLPESSLTDLRVDEDIHELNTEIVRLAYFLNVDISDEAAVESLVTRDLPDDHEHFYKLATLKGLIMLRDHIHQLRAEHGVPDARGPLEEAIFQRLNLHIDDEVGVKI